MTGGVGASGIYWGAGRDCRYSGASKGTGGIRGIGAPRGVGAILGVSGGVGVSGCIWGLAGTLGTEGPEGA